MDTAISGTRTRRAREALALEYWPAMLTLSALVLLPFARLIEWPLLVMVVIGLRRLMKQPAEVLALPASRWFLLLFACYWVPCALSAPDAAYPIKSWSTVAAQLRFVPFAVFCMFYLDRRQLTWLAGGIAWLTLFWTVDALVQALFEVNLLGMPAVAERLNGVFGPTNIKLGHVLATLAPFPLEMARRSGNRLALIVTYALLMGVIIIIGTRAAWIMYAVVTLAFIYLYARRHPRRWLKATLFVVAGATAFVAAAYQGSDHFRGRIDRSMAVLEGGEQAVDRALSLRLPIWQTAMKMGRHHWVNGVGVRSFRHAYPEYAEEGDFWVAHGNDDTGAYHAHQLVLEVWTETGLFGLVGLLGGLAVAAVAWRRSTVADRHRAMPFAVGIVAMLFPFNSHLAFYSTFWSLLFWWLTVLFVVTLHPALHRR